MTPSDYYKKAILSKNLTEDARQITIMQQLDEIAHALIQENQHRKKFFSVIRKNKTVKGLYVSGAVGIGKTFMMDCFFHALPFQNKMRMHFHSFMQYIHESLKEMKGKKNPLLLIAKNIAKKNIVICFDEFFVSDIADAMILAKLFEGLFSEGVTLIATSNTSPDKLYERGLQRQQFLPTISLIQTHTHVMHLSSTTDYRLISLKNGGIYYTPNDEIANQKMTHIFSLLTQEAEVDADPITVHDRAIRVIKKANDVIWFEFNAICSVPRSQTDYLTLATHYHTVLISNVPKINEHEHNHISFFIKLVDVFYDQRIRLILSAETGIDDIYTSGRLIKEFLRTRSRLHEMQSWD